MHIHYLLACHFLAFLVLAVRLIFKVKESPVVASQASLELEAKLLVIKFKNRKNQQHPLLRKDGFPPHLLNQKIPAV